MSKGTARDAAPLICTGITSYKGVKETQARPGEWIVISGIGGLGHLGVQYATAMGLHVCAVDIMTASSSTPNAWARATRL